MALNESRANRREAAKVSRNADEEQIFALREAAARRALRCPVPPPPGFKFDNVPDDLADGTTVAIRIAKTTFLETVVTTSCPRFVVSEMDGNNTHVTARSHSFIPVDTTTAMNIVEGYEAMIRNDRLNEFLKWATLKVNE